MFYSVVSLIGSMLLLPEASTSASIILRKPTKRGLQITPFDAVMRRKAITSTRTSSKFGFLQKKVKYGPVCSESNGNHDAERLKFGPNASKPGYLREKFPAFSWHLLPNWLTYCRCIAIPILIVFFYSTRCNIIPCGIFALASASDYLDGYLARRWDVSSEFGAFLDPVADKLMVSTALILLVGRYGAPIAIPTSIILAREIAVSALREWMAGKGLRKVVQVGVMGKIKTATTMLSLTLLLLVPTSAAYFSYFWRNMRALSFTLLYISTLLTVMSGSSYFRAAAPFLRK